MYILKFGGTALADASRIKDVINIIKGYRKEHPEIILVISAMSGVTDKLINLCEVISSQTKNYEEVLQELEQQHLQVLKNLLPVMQQPAAFAEVMSLCNELSDIVKGASLVGEVTSRTRDLILSFGERLSAYVISQSLKNEFPDVFYVDARNIIVTDETYGQAKVDFESSNILIRDFFGSKKGVSVVTGFIAATGKGQTTTLGRSGSDYTASIIGAALDAEAVEIWSDVDGVMTADPRYVAEAQCVAHLSYSEAMELSHFGAKIVFPATMQPAMAKKIPIYVKNSYNPSHKGTLINNEATQDNGFIKGITSLKNICIINVEGSGMVGVAGVSTRMFNTLSQQNISVILISQASSEHSICIAIMKEDAERARTLLRLTFAGELKANLISSINYESDLAIVAVVGENMRHMPGVAARVFSPLGRNGINVKAISQGSSELNISFVINETDLKKTLRILHQSLFNKEMRRLHLYVAGTGSIGSRLLDMIQNHGDFLAAQKIDLWLCGLTNSRHMLAGESAIDLDKWKNTLKENSEKANLRNFVEKILSQNLENSVFIDVTASSDTVQYYEKLMSGNVAIVAANKRANTQDMGKYRSLQNAARIRNVPFHYETNVGAGLPVINVLRSIMAGGDKVKKIEAVLSGTINWLLSEYNGVIPFSELVRMARNKGYTEPDPRDDLSGMDVARKALILARECGFGMELGDIPVMALMTEQASGARDMQSFFNMLKEYDPLFHAEYEVAVRGGRKLRYVAVIENGVAKVELTSVDASHPFYGLGGTENCIMLTTNYYQMYPMVIKGPGAGVDVTSAGLLADIVRIAEGIRI
jgi:aspartokinase/homoserine dehydrogenase 1